MSIASYLSCCSQLTRCFSCRLQDHQTFERFKDIFDYRGALITREFDQRSRQRNALINIAQLDDEMFVADGSRAGSSIRCRNPQRRLPPDPWLSVTKAILDDLRTRSQDCPPGRRFAPTLSLKW